MNRIIVSAALVVAVMAASPVARAVNKCTGPDGKVSLQDAPCTDGRAERLNLRPASGQAPVTAVAAPPDAAAPAAAPAAPQTEAQRLECAAVTCTP